MKIDTMTKKIFDTLREELDDETYQKVETVIIRESLKWSEEYSNELHTKAIEWEQSMPPEKEGFYSLAMRRIASEIIGEKIG